MAPSSFSDGGLGATWNLAGSAGGGRDWWVTSMTSRMPDEMVDGAGGGRIWPQARLDRCIRARCSLAAELTGGGETHDRHQSYQRVSCLDEVPDGGGEQGVVGAPGDRV